MTDSPAAPPAPDTAHSSFYWSPLPDFPAWESDLLDQGDLQHLIHSALLFADAPQVLAVEGSWGSGKTGLLHRLYHEFEGDCPQNPGFQPVAKPDETKLRRYSHTRVIWFEAWRYQHEEKPVVALLYEIRRQLSEGRKQSILSRLFSKKSDIAILTAALENLGTALDITAKYLAVAGLAAAGLDPSLATIALAGKALAGMMRHVTKDKDDKTPGNPTADIRASLNSAITAYLTHLCELQEEEDRTKYGPPKPRLIIMIDDLDRCEAATAFRLLEGIKTWLDLPSCVFLLGVNRRELRRAISSQLLPVPGHSVLLQKADIRDSQRDAERDAAARADEYMEKLCHHCWPVPLLDVWQRLVYLEKCLSTLPRMVFNDVKAFLPQKPDAYTHIAPLDPALLLPPNPRRIKALANRLRYLLGRNDRKPAGSSLPLNPDNLACAWFAAVASVMYSELFRMIQDEPALIIPLIRHCQGRATAAELPKCISQLDLAFRQIEGGRPGTELMTTVLFVSKSDAPPLNAVNMSRTSFDDSDPHTFLLQPWVIAYEKALMPDALLPWLKL